MKINVWSLNEAGPGRKIDVQEPWLVKLIQETLASEKPQLSALKGELTIHRINDIVSINGELTLPIKPTCVLCLEVYTTDLNVDLQMDLSPQYHPDKKPSKFKEVAEELELNADDLNFSFYDNAEIQLDSLLKEQILLSLPNNFICTPKCRGLCPRCGINLNESSCDCSSQLPEDSPWAALKAFKADKKALT